MIGGGRPLRLWLFCNAGCTPARPAAQRGRGEVRERPRKKCPGRGGSQRQACGIGFGQARGREGASRLGGQGLHAPARTVHHCDWHHGEDLAPALPAIKGGEVVGAHDPDEAHQRAARLEKCQRGSGVGWLEVLLKICDYDVRIFCQCAAQENAFVQRHRSGPALQRVARRYHPPDLVESEPLQRRLADHAMGEVRRVERTAQQADGLARGRVGWARLDAAKGGGGGKAHARYGRRLGGSIERHNLAWTSFAAEELEDQRSFNRLAKRGQRRAEAVSRPAYCLNSADRENEEARTTGGFSATCGWGSSR